ncbi:MAG: heme o synthase [Nitrososphaerota archaeon]
MSGSAQAPSTSLVTAVRTYFVLTKPNVWWLLVFTGIGGYFAGSSGTFDPITFALTAASLSAACAGAETVANYLERDIDAVMTRTRRRPLPSGKITPPERALYFGLLLTATGIALSSLINLYALAFTVFGVLDYVVVYVMLTKRRTPLNVILGSFSGGAPALIGYTAATGFPDVYGWLLAALVVLWIPSHVWSLAMKYREDYRRAGVPMLPVVIEERKAIRCIVSTVVLLVAFSLALPIAKPSLGPLYLSVAALLGGALLFLSIKTALRPTFENFWRLFKFTSPYLAVLFAAIVLEALL